MAKYSTLKALFTAIANSLRAKTGGTGTIVADDFPTVIDGLSTGGITPTGTKNITSNGTHDVTSYASAQVNVPVGITPSGTKNITENGTYDVTNFANAAVNVPSSAKTLYTIPITIDAALGGGANSNKAVLSGHDFVKTNYANENFFAMWFPVSATTAAPSGVVGMVYHGNRAMLTAKATLYGIFIRSTGETANLNYMGNTAKLSGSGYNVSLRANSSGNINLYVASAYTVPAGEYLLVLGLIG